jgi:hypothetical protein
LQDLADRHLLVDQPAIQHADQVGFSIIDYQPAGAIRAAAGVMITVWRPYADELAGAGFLPFATAEPLTQGVEARPVEPAAAIALIAEICASLNS